MNQKSYSPKIIVSLGLLAFAPSAIADTPSVHGMLLFGDKTSYASHLPMFHAPHDYQAIFELKLEASPETPDTLKQYESLKKQGNGNLAVFTLEPEVMDLSQLISGTKDSFKAEIYAGHFERGGHSLGSVLAKVSKVVFSQKLKATKPQNSQFFAFGQNGEYYAAKVIGGKPGYDAVLKISMPMIWKAEKCPSRLCGRLFPNEAEDTDFPKQATGSLSTELTPPYAGDLVGPGKADAQEGSFQFKVDEVIYSESGDLAQ